MLLRLKHLVRNHILEDLRPYLCPYSNCAENHRMWSSRSEWEAHIETQHKTLALLRDHTRADERLRMGICPICGFMQFRTGTAEDIRRGTVFHIAQHMENIALFHIQDDTPEYIPEPEVSPLVRHRKRYRRRKHQRRRFGLTQVDGSSSSSGDDEQTMQGCSSDSSACSNQGRR
jgi:hypothetical protein